MNVALRIFAVIYLPAIIGLVAGFCQFVGFRTFGGNPELPPLPVEIAEFAGMFAAIVLPAILVLPLWKRKKVAFVLLAVLLAPYSLLRESMIGMEFISYLGYSCCLEYPATLMSTAEALLNPVWPFYLWV